MCQRWKLRVNLKSQRFEGAFSTVRAGERTMCHWEVISFLEDIG
jgi:hypothetical protein